MSNIRKVMLTLPNYQWFGRRTWRLAPYGLGLLNATLKPRYDSWIYDPNFTNDSEERMRQVLRETAPDAVGISTFSTEYVEEPRHVAAIVREELPEAVIIVGGIIPTVLPGVAAQDRNVDYFVAGEGEYRLPALLDALNGGERNPEHIDGLTYWRDGVLHSYPLKEFIQDLDPIPFPDYGDLDFSLYATAKHTYALQLIPRHYPFATTVSTRGCPYRCTFCAASTVSGKKIRARSAENVLREIDWLSERYGVREIIFLDDHFLANRRRAVDIMKGIMERKSIASWKCSNVAIFSLDEEILDLMAASGCYQMTVSIESGVQETLDKLIKKPVNLKKVPAVLESVKRHGLELVSNFVFGFPGETWERIRQTIAFAERLPLDCVNFHIATPLPKTELMKTCIERGYLSSETDTRGYTAGVIATDEFSPQDLQILRAYEWDRLNFSTPDKVAVMARLHGLTLEETEEWRKRTRRNLGTTINWKQ